MTDAIRHELDVAGPPDVAFEVFTLGMGRWWDPAYSPDPATYDGIAIAPEVGAELSMVHGEEAFTFGTVLVWEPGSRYVQTFSLAMDPAHPSTLEVTFTPAGSGCHVKFAHGGWSEENQASRSKYGDWPHLLKRYADAVAAAWSG